MHTPRRTRRPRRAPSQRPSTTPGTPLGRSPPRYPSTRYASLPGPCRVEDARRRGMHADARCMRSCSGKPYRTCICATCAVLQMRFAKVLWGRRSTQRNAYAAETLMGRAFARNERRADSRCAGNPYRTGVFAARAKQRKRLRGKTLCRKALRSTIISSGDRRYALRLRAECTVWGP